MDAGIAPLQGHVQRIVRAAEAQLLLVGKFEQLLNRQLGNKSEAMQKLLRRHLPLGGYAARALEGVLQTVTKYEVRVLDADTGLPDNNKLSTLRSCTRWPDERPVLYESLSIAAAL